MNNHRDLTQARNEEFLRRCRKMFRDDYEAGTMRPLQEIINTVMHQQPRGHYLNYETASRRLHLIERRGLEAVVTEELGRQMWTELRAQVDEVMARQKKKSFQQALTFVLTFCRPSRFYITYDTARRILTPYISYSITLNRC